MTDVFVHDRTTGRATRVSVSSDGLQANGPSVEAALSADGRFVAFTSSATNLIPEDTNGETDVFLRDRAKGTTTRVSLAADGGQANSSSGFPSISADGRFFAFASAASNLVEGDTNGLADVFVRDLETGAISRVSLSSSGTQAIGLSGTSSLSADGRSVVFVSSASNLVPRDLNRVPDVFVHDRQTGKTTLASVSSRGEQANSYSDSGVPAISSDGHFAVFGSFAWNLVPGDTNQAPDVFVHDLTTGATTLASVSSEGAHANNSSRTDRHSVSRDGRIVAFSSFASNLVAGDMNGAYDVFVHDQLTGETTRVSVAGGGVEANRDSRGPAVSGDGRFVAFDSVASNLVRRDTNKARDVFVHDWRKDETMRVSVGNLDAQCRVPRLVGLTLGRARKRVAATNCSLGRVRSRPSPRPSHTVIAQSPKAGSLRAPRAKVSLVVDRGQRR